MRSAVACIAASFDEIIGIVRVDEKNSVVTEPWGCIMLGSGNVALLD